jgi:hypothetical protein
MHLGPRRALVRSHRLVLKLDGVCVCAVQGRAFPAAPCAEGMLRQVLEGISGALAFDWQAIEAVIRSVGGGLMLCGAAASRGVECRGGREGWEGGLGAQRGQGALGQGWSGPPRPVCG